MILKADYEERNLFIFMKFFNIKADIRGNFLLSIKFPMQFLLIKQIKTIQLLWRLYFIGVSISICTVREYPLP